MSMVRTPLVYLYDYETGNERRYSHDVEEKVGSCASAFLGSSVRRLKNKSRLCYEDKTCLVFESISLSRGEVGKALKAAYRVEKL